MTGNKKPAFLRVSCESMAEWTGLEPATLGVTGRYSNQLNYRSMKLVLQLVFPHARWLMEELVGAEGFEPPTLSL